MHELTIFIRNDIKGSSIRAEKMLMRSLEVPDILNGLRSRGTLHSIDSQLDIIQEIDHNGGYINLSDIITGEHIVSVMW